MVAHNDALKTAPVLRSRLMLPHIVKAPPAFEVWSPSRRRARAPVKTKAVLEPGRVARVAEDHGVMTETTLIEGVPEDSISKVAEAGRSA